MRFAYPENYKKISTAVKITTVLKIAYKSIVFLMCRELGGDLYHSHDRIYVIVYAQDTSDPCTVHAHGLVLVGIPDAQAIRRLLPWRKTCAHFTKNSYFSRLWLSSVSRKNKAPSH